MVRGYLNLAALLLIAAPAPFAQSPAVDDVQRPHDCGSVVIIKCNRPVSEPGSEQTRQLGRRTELRRQAAGIQQLEGIVIEGEAVRRRSIEEIMGSAFPIFRSRNSSHAFEASDGSKCTCMNVCPPPPLPCCQCSANLSRYRQTPGSSPLN
ncbi:MAG TPA: hypothetical protein VNA44_10175 [Burkholderiaceae bacterium]|nr:hypothetical protein [Burkholderiaceae bacterium]